MLRELNISNLAVIEDASIEFMPGLNVFTGQTGAGKSLVIGAFEILLGLRSGGKEDAGGMLRPGAEEARISGLFEIRDSETAAAVEQAIDRKSEPGEEIVITRRIFSSNRTSASVNGSPVTVSMLKNLAEYLVDIHGQHDHQYLLKPFNQLNILDLYGDCTVLRNQYSQQYATLRQLKDRLKALEESACRHGGRRRGNIRIGRLYCRTTGDRLETTGRTGPDRLRKTGAGPAADP